MNPMTKTVLALSVLTMAACSPSSSGNGTGGGGNNPPPNAPNPSKLENVTTVTSQDYYTALSEATKTLCPQGYSSADKDAVQGMTVLNWSTSESAVRRQSTTTSTTLTQLSANQVVWQTKLISAFVSDFTGALPLGKVITTATHTRVTNTNGQTYWDYRTDMGEIDPALAEYMKNRKLDIDEAASTCQIKIQTVTSDASTYYKLNFTLSSGKTVNAFKVDSKEQLSIECPGQPALVLPREIQTIYSTELVGENAEYCSPMTQLRRATTTKDLNGNILKTDVEEILDSNLRKAN